jgi:hypothetical protein
MLSSLIMAVDLARKHNSFGTVCMRAGKLEMAVKHFSKALELAEDLPFSNAHHNLANTYCSLKMPAEAKHHFQRAIEVSPYNLPERPADIDSHFNAEGAYLESFTNLAVLYMMEERLDEAQECCHKAISLSPSGSEAHINLGNLLRQLQRRSEAIEHVWTQVEVSVKADGGEFERPSMCDVGTFELPPDHMEGLLHVVCVKWGTKYGADYVNKLYRGVTRHLTLPHDFTCFTEDPSGLDEGVLTLPLVESWNNWWGKATLFAPHGLTGRLLYIDLDSVITGSLDDLGSYRGVFALMSTKEIYCEKAKDGYNSSIIAWHSSFGQPIYDSLRRYYKYVLKYICRFDFWLEMTVHNSDFVQDCFPGQFLDYVSCCQDDVPADCRIVAFPRDPKPHEAKAGWIQELWQ